MKLVPAELLKRYDCDSFKYLGKVKNLDCYRLYNKKNEDDDIGYTGFPLFLFFDGKEYRRGNNGKEILDALGLIKKSSQDE